MDTGGISPEERQRQTAAEIARKKVVAAYQQSQPAWQQYHTAWQNYYQKYYSEYYAKAASKYVAGEKQKLEEEAKKQNLAMQNILQQRAEQQKQQILAEQMEALRQQPQTAHRVPIISTEKPSTEEKEQVEHSLRSAIQKKADSKFKLKKKYRKWVPLAAGLFVMLFVLFLQYNRLIFAPIMAYISPGNATDEEIAAIDPTVTDAPSAESRLIIPKLNVDVPVFFGISNDTATINDAMIKGVAHFRVPGAEAFPGEVGNTVITGHSAGDIYSNVQYKFIFSGLERLVDGDLIYVNYNSVRYTYKVTGRDTVDSSDVQSLVYDGDKPILTLLTCWPTGTSRYRLLIIAEQINPAPAATEGEETTTEPETPVEKPAEMPSNEKTFFERAWDWLTGNS